MTDAFDRSDVTQERAEAHRAKAVRDATRPARAFDQGGGGQPAAPGIPVARSAPMSDADFFLSYFEAQRRGDDPAVSYGPPNRPTSRLFRVPESAEDGPAIKITKARREQEERIRAAERILAERPWLIASRENPDTMAAYLPHIEAIAKHDALTSELGERLKGIDKDIEVAKNRIKYNEKAARLAELTAEIERLRGYAGEALGDVSGAGDILDPDAVTRAADAGDAAVGATKLRQQLIEELRSLHGPAGYKELFDEGWVERLGDTLVQRGYETGLGIGRAYSAKYARDVDSLLVRAREVPRQADATSRGAPPRDRLVFEFRPKAGGGVLGAGFPFTYEPIGSAPRGRDPMASGVATAAIEGWLAAEGRSRDELLADDRRFVLEGEDAFSFREYLFNRYSSSKDVLGYDEKLFEVELFRKSLGTAQGSWGNFGEDALVAAIENAPQIVAGLVVGLVNPVAGAAVTTLPAAVRSYSGGYLHAIRSGASEEAARTVGTLHFIAEMAPATASYAISLRAARSAGEPLAIVNKSWVDGFFSDLNKVSRGVATNALTEFPEEFITSLGQTGANIVMLDEQTTLKRAFDNAVRDGFIGLVSGGATAAAVSAPAGVASAVRRAAYRRREDRIEKRTEAGVAAEEQRIWSERSRSAAERGAALEKARADSKREPAEGEPKPAPPRYSGDRNLQQIGQRSNLAFQSAAVASKDIDGLIVRHAELQDSLKNRPGEEALTDTTRATYADTVLALEAAREGSPLAVQFEAELLAKMREAAIDVADAVTVQDIADILFQSPNADALVAAAEKAARARSKPRPMRRLETFETLAQEAQSQPLRDENPDAYFEARDASLENAGIGEMSIRMEKIDEFFQRDVPEGDSAALRAARDRADRYVAKKLGVDKKKIERARKVRGDIKFRTAAWETRIAGDRDADSALKGFDQLIRMNSRLGAERQSAQDFMKELALGQKLLKRPSPEETRTEADFLEELEKENVGYREVYETTRVALAVAFPSSPKYAESQALLMTAMVANAKRNGDGRSPVAIMEHMLGRGGPQTQQRFGDTSTEKPMSRSDWAAYMRRQQIKALDERVEMERAVRLEANRKIREAEEQALINDMSTDEDLGAVDEDAVPFESGPAEDRYSPGAMLPPATVQGERVFMDGLRGRDELHAAIDRMSAKEREAYAKRLNELYGNQGRRGAKTYLHEQVNEMAEQSLDVEGSPERALAQSDIANALSSDIYDKLDPNAFDEAPVEIAFSDATGENIVTIERLTEERRAEIIESLKPGDYVITEKPVMVPASLVGAIPVTINDRKKHTRKTLAGEPSLLAEGRLPPVLVNEDGSILRSQMTDRVGVTEVIANIAPETDSKIPVYIVRERIVEEARPGAIYQAVKDQVGAATKDGELRARLAQKLFDSTKEMLVDEGSLDELYQIGPVTQRDYSATETALAMFEAGASAEEVFAETLIFMDEDGELKREFSDKNAKLKLDDNLVPAALSGPKVQRLGDIFDHEKLYEAFSEFGGTKDLPKMEDIQTVRLSDEQMSDLNEFFTGEKIPDGKMYYGGFFWGDKESSAYQAPHLNGIDLGKPLIIFNSEADLDYIRYTLNHEAGHYGEVLAGWPKQYPNWVYKNRLNEANQTAVMKRIDRDEAELRETPFWEDRPYHPALLTIPRPTESSGPTISRMIGPRSPVVTKVENPLRVGRSQTDRYVAATKIMSRLGEPVAWPKAAFPYTAKLTEKSAIGQVYVTAGKPYSTAAKFGDPRYGSDHLLIVKALPEIIANATLQKEVEPRAKHGGKARRNEMEGVEKVYYLDAVVEIDGKHMAFSFTVMKRILAEGKEPVNMLYAARRHTGKWEVDLLSQAGFRETKAPSKANRKKLTIGVRQPQVNPEEIPKLSDTKIVDENGKPKPLYVGTFGNFSTFQPGGEANDLGSAIYLTDKSNSASDVYASKESVEFDTRIMREAERIAISRGIALDDNRIFAIEDEVRDQISGHDGAVMKLYVYMGNPATLKQGGGTFLKRSDGTLEKFIEEFRKAVRARNAYAPGLEAKLSEFDAGVHSSISLASVYDKLLRGGWAYRRDDNGDHVEDSLIIRSSAKGHQIQREIFRAALEGMGFDGIADQTVHAKFPHSTEADETHYIVFKPSHVKSATGNSGAFDLGDPNILRQDSSGPSFARGASISTVANFADSVANAVAKGDTPDFTTIRNIKAVAAELRMRREKLIELPAAQQIDAIIDIVARAEPDPDRPGADTLSMALVEGFGDIAAPIILGSDLSQGGYTGTRGVTRINPDGSTSVALADIADFSTFAHESAHAVFLYMMWAKDQSWASDQLKDTFSQITTWMGLGNNSDAEIMAILSDRSVSRQYHERLARAAERHIMTGIAPIPELQGAFSFLGALLRGVYRAFQFFKEMFAGSDAIQNGVDIRKQLDRLYATDAMIAQAEDEGAFHTFFKSAGEAGLTQKQWNTLKRQQEQAQEAYYRRLMLVATRAASAEEDEAHKQAMALARPEARSNVGLRREYRALDALTRSGTKEAPAPRISQVSFLETYETGPEVQNIRTLAERQKQIEKELAEVEKEQSKADKNRPIVAFFRARGGIDIDSVNTAEIFKTLDVRNAAEANRRAPGLFVKGRGEKRLDAIPSDEIEQYTGDPLPNEGEYVELGSLIDALVEEINGDRPTPEAQGLAAQAESVRARLEDVEAEIERRDPGRKLRQRSEEMLKTFPKGGPNGAATITAKLDVGKQRGGVIAVSVEEAVRIVNAELNPGERFNSPDQLFKALSGLPTFRKAVDEEAARLAGPRPNNFDDETRQEVEDAMRGELMMAYLEDEIEILARFANAKGITRQSAKEVAKALSGSMTLKEATAWRTFLRKERQVTKEVERAITDQMAAIGAKSGQRQVRAAVAFEKTLHLKSNQLLAMAMTAESIALDKEMKAFRKKVDALRKHIKTLKGRNRANIRNLPIDPEYLDQIANILSMYRFTRPTKKERAEREQYINSLHAAGIIEEKSMTYARWRAAKIAKGEDALLVDNSVVVRRTDDDGFETMKEVAIGEEAVARDYLDPEHGLTVEEMRGVMDVIKNLEHLGRLKKDLGRKAFAREIDRLAGKAVEGIDARARRPRKEGRVGAETWVERRMSGVSRFFSTWMTASEIVTEYLEGGVEIGPLWEVFVGDFMDAETQKIRRQQGMAKKLNAIFSKHLTPSQIHGLHRKKKIGSIEASHADLLMFGLNMGNRSNIDVVKQHEDYGKDAVYKTMFDSLTVADWQLVQEVWDLIAELRPDIVALEKRTTGIAPEMIEPEPVFTGKTLPDGSDLVLEGGYFPVSYADGETRSEDPIDAASSEFGMPQSDQMRAHGRAATKQGFMIRRVEAEKHGRQIAFDLSIISRHIRVVTHDIYFREPVVKAEALLRNETFRDAFDKGGRQWAYSKIRAHVMDMASGEMGPTDPFSAWLSVTRGMVSQAVMGWSPMSAMVQNLGFTSSLVVVKDASALAEGYRAGARASVQLAMSGKVSPIVQEIHAESEQMKLRSEVMNADIMTANVALRGDGLNVSLSNGNGYRIPLQLLELIATPAELNKLRGGKMGAKEFSDWWIRNAFWMITKTQQTVDIPLYLAARAEGLKKFNGDRRRAIKYAEEAVSKAQGALLFSQQSFAQRGTYSPTSRQNAYFKNLFFLHTYAATKVNHMARAMMRLRYADSFDEAVKASANIVYTTIMITYVEAFFYILLTQTLKGDLDEDDLTIGALVETAATIAQPFPFVNDMVSMARGFDPSVGVYAQVPIRLFKAAQQIGQAELDPALWRSLNNAAGSLTPLPGVRVLNAAISSAEKDAEWYNYLFGVEYKGR